MHMSRIVLSTVACLAVPYYFTLDLSHEQQDLRKRDIEHKMGFDFLYNWKISDSKNKRVRHKGADKSSADPIEKNNWKVAIFRPRRRSFLPRRPGWKDNFLNCFWVACKS